MDKMTGFIRLMVRGLELKNHDESRCVLYLDPKCEMLCKAPKKNHQDAEVYPISSLTSFTASTKFVHFGDVSVSVLVVGHQHGILELEVESPKVDRNNYPYPAPSLWETSCDLQPAISTLHPVTPLFGFFVSDRNPPLDRHKKWPGANFSTKG